MRDIEEFLNYYHIDFIQSAILIMGVTEVLLARANNVWLYPAGILATVLSIYSLFNAQLYAESMLNFYYLVMSIYGWMYWVTKRNNVEVKVGKANNTEWYITGVLVFGGWALLYGILVSFTPSDVPIWDAWVSATGWAGMWLLARRKVENWILLNISNAFAIPLLIHKELYLFALLTGFLFIVACVGYVDWLKIIKRESQACKAVLL